MNKNWTTIAVTALITFALGFGASQITLANTVTRTSSKIESLEREQAQYEARTEARILKLADMFAASNDLVRQAIAQSTRMVDTIELQNKLIQEQWQRFEKMPPPPRRGQAPE